MSFRTNRRTRRVFYTNASVFTKEYNDPSNLKRLKISKIGGFLTEGRMSKSYYKSYKDAILRGEKIEPLDVQLTEDGHYNLVDGSHRLEALKSLGVKTALVNVHQPNEEDK